MSVEKEVAHFVSEGANLRDKIIVIGDAFTTTGFRLAGIADYIIADGKKAEKALEQNLDREDVGIIIINEKVLAEADWRLRKRIDAMAKPSVVTVPDRSGKSFEEESLGVLVKRALGFDLMKK